MSNVVSVDPLQKWQIVCPGFVDTKQSLEEAVDVTLVRQCIIYSSDFYPTAFQISSLRKCLDELDPPIPPSSMARKTDTQSIGIIAFDI